MGEVTNAYPVIRNYGPAELTEVCTTLSASDEARAHPDKTGCVPSLPSGYQVTLKLTVDTGFEKDTSIHVSVSTQQGITANASQPSCRALGLPDWVTDQVGGVRPIQ